MTGYLERLASSVLRPGGSIRPVLTPVLAAPHHEPPALPLEEETIARPAPRPGPELRQELRALEPATPASASTATTSTRPPTPPRPSIVATATHAEPPHAAIAPAPADRAIPPGSANQSPPPGPLVKAPTRSDTENDEPSHREAFRVLNPPDQKDRPATGDRSTGIAPPREPSVISVHQLVASPTPLKQPPITPAAEPNPDQARKSTEDKRPPEAPTVILRDRPVPLSAQERDNVDAPPAASAEPKAQFTPLIKPALSPPAVQLMRDSPPRPAPPAQEPDEIHIHIGRIEVMASAPAPARPAPAKAARKSLTLDEYLKQRHGRA